MRALFVRTGLKRFAIRTLALAAILTLLPASIASAEQKSLDECLALALREHPSLGAAAAEVEAAHQRVWQAASGYLPQIGASQSFQRQQTSTGITTSTDFAAPPSTSNVFRSGFSLSQVLFDFGQNLASIRAGQAGERSARADERQQEQAVVFQVKQAYFNLLAAQQLEHVAEQTSAQNKQLLDEARARHEVGLAPRFDVTRAQVQVAQADLDLLSAQNSVAVSRETLANAIGLGRELDFDIVDTPPPATPPIPWERAVEAAYQNRPELQSLAEQQEAGHQRIAALRRDYLPAISGNANYNWSGSETPLQESWSLTAALNLSLFNGGLTTAQIGEQEASLARLQYDEEQQRQNIALEVRRAALDLARAAASVGVAATGAEQARENLAIARGRYQSGVGNILELTDAQTSDTAAAASYVQAVYDHQIAIAAVEKATGAPIASLRDAL